MILTLFFIVCAQVTLTSSAKISEPRMEEYCNYEVFRASCASKGHVIRITKAFYGRMQHGKCIEPDYDMVGCHADVTHIAEARCSGQVSCNISIPDRPMDDASSCRTDLKTFLMISYTCIKVYVPELNNNCNVSSDMAMRGERSSSQNSLQVLLPSINPSSSSCGKNKPWVIKRGEGERIAVSILDFTGIKRNFSSVMCDIIAKVKEQPSGHPVHTCAGEVMDITAPHTSHFLERTITVSEAEYLEITMSSPRNMGKYIVKIQFLCSDPTYIQGAMWNRHALNGTFTCLNSHKVFPFTCVDRKWQGTMEMKNIQHFCSTTFFEGHFSSLPYLQRSHVIAIVLVMLIAGLVGIFIFFCGYCVIKNRKPLTTANTETNYQQISPSKLLSEGALKTDYYMATGGGCKQMHEENLYASVDEVVSSLKTDTSITISQSIPRMQPTFQKTHMQAYMQNNPYDQYHHQLLQSPYNINLQQNQTSLEPPPPPDDSGVSV